MEARFGDRQLHGGRDVSGDLELEVSLFQVEDKRPNAMAIRNPRRSLTESLFVWTEYVQ